jgi:hypothetical protein
MAETDKVKGKNVFQFYFFTTEGDSTLHKCKECTRSVKQNITKGYANLVTHVTTIHKEDYAQKIKAFKESAASGAMILSSGDPPKQRQNSKRSEEIKRDGLPSTT